MHECCARRNSNFANGHQPLTYLSRWIVGRSAVLPWPTYSRSRSSIRRITLTSQKQPLYPDVSIVPSVRHLPIPEKCPIKGCWTKPLARQRA